MSAVFIEVRANEYTGRDAETLGSVITGVRAACHLILMPTLGTSTVPDPHARLAPVLELAAEPTTRPELATVDQTRAMLGVD